MPKEAKARIRINDLLTRSGWRFFDDENGPANIALEANVKLTRKKLDALGVEHAAWEMLAESASILRSQVAQGIDRENAEEVVQLLNKVTRLLSKHASSKRQVSDMWGNEGNS